MDNGDGEIVDGASGRPLAVGGRGAPVAAEARVPRLRDHRAGVAQRQEDRCHVGPVLGPLLHAQQPHLHAPQHLRAAELAGAGHRLVEQRQRVAFLPQLPRLVAINNFLIRNCNCNALFWKFWTYALD